MEIEKPFRLTLKLKEGKAPHLYVTQIAALMKNDKSLHPMMEKTLKMLKNTRTPYIRLAMLREIVVDPLNFRHFDRAAGADNGPWVCTLWSEQEISEHKKNPQGHIKAMTKMFEALGYEMFNMQICSNEYIQTLSAMTANQIERQMVGREMEE